MAAHDRSMPEGITGRAKSLWERQGPLKPGEDDGKGCYTYCRFGNSNCLDSFCPCAPTLSYRLMYLVARGCSNPLRYGLVLITSPVVIGLIVVAFLGWWVIS